MRVLALFLFAPLFVLAAGSALLTTFVVAATIGTAVRLSRPRLEDNEN